MTKSKQLLQGDPQKEYLRIQNELVTGWTYANPLPELVERMGRVRSQLDPVWLATVRTCTTPPAPIDVGRLLPNLAPLAKTTVRLNPRPGSAANDASKMGGVFLWPKDELWPHCEDHDTAYVGALQLRKEDFLEVEFRPGTDLMQVLWCPNDHEPGYCPDVRVIWRRRADVADAVEVHPRPATHDVAYTEYVPDPCLLYPERIVEYPDPFEKIPVPLYELLGDALDVAVALECSRQLVTKPWSPLNDASSLYQCALSTADGTKIGGYPDWVQDPWYPKCACGATMDYLLSFSSQEFDGATWFRWLPIEERDVLHAERAMQQSVICAANYSFGDAGTMYVFICRKCADWPTTAGMQCS